MKDARQVIRRISELRDLCLALARAGRAAGLETTGNHRVRRKDSDRVTTEPLRHGANGKGT
jgi:hypothetical protein